MSKLRVGDQFSYTGLEGLHLTYTIMKIHGSQTRLTIALPRGGFQDYDIEVFEGIENHAGWIKEPTTEDYSLDEELFKL